MTHPPPGGQYVWLTYQEVQLKMGVSRTTVYNWVRLQKVIVSRTPGSRPMIREDSLVRPHS